MYPYLNEFLPSQAVTIASIIKWGISVIITRFALTFINSLGVLAVFLFFTVTSLVLAGLIAGFGVETFGKSDLVIH